MIKNKVSVMLLVILTFMFSPASFAKTIKIATLSPEGTFWMKQMRAGAKEIKEKTQGRVKFKFYPGGVMGNDDSVLRKIRVGQLHGGAVTLGAISHTTPDVSVYGFPYLFSSLDEAAEIRKTTDPLLTKIIEDNGFVTFGVAQAGFTYLMSNKPVKSLDDLRKQKSWVPEKNEVGLSIYQYVGITPISLPLSDVLTGLQTGLINTVVASPIAALALQWHTHINYVTDQPLSYLSGTMIVNKKVFNKIKAADQKIVRTIMSNVYKAIDEKNKIDNLAAREALINQGVQFIKISDSEKAEWETIDDLVIKKLLAKHKYNPELYNAVTVNKLDAPKLN